MEDRSLRKYTLHRLKSKLIEKKYESLIKDDTNIIVLLENYIESLKTINTLYSRADIESLKYEGTSYPDTLFRNEQIYRHKFFALVFGIIDERQNELINFNKDKECAEELNLIYNLRERVLNDYKKNSNIIDPKFIINALENIPCYLHFTDNINNINNENDIKLYLEFIESYIKGTNNYRVCGLKEIYDIYRRLLRKLNKCKRNNKNKVYKLKKDISND